MSGEPQRSRAERISLGIALTLLALLVGAVIFLWLSPQHEPTFRVERGEPRRAASGYYLPISVVNEGDGTASEVTVTGIIGERGEAASTTFDFIPGHARVEGVLVFDTDPAAATVRVSSFQLP